MSREKLTPLEIYLNKRIKDIKFYLKANERSEDEKGFPPSEELQICRLAKRALKQEESNRELEKQIGCPLDFVTTPYKLSGLKKVWYHDQWCEVVRIVVYEEATKPYMEVRCKDYKYLKMILLEDCGKTWFLTKEESQA